jgi:hypothetical protein
MICGMKELKIVNLKKCPPLEREGQGTLYYKTIEMKFGFETSKLRPYKWIKGHF